MSHTFEVDSEWLENYSGSVKPRGAPPPVTFGIPPEFGGEGGQWTPEHFLAAAVGTCIQATFLTIATASGVKLKAYTTRAACTMAKGGSGFEVTAVAITARVVVADEKSHERAERAVRKAEAMCPISKALGALVSFEGRVEVGS